MRLWLLVHLLLIRQLFSMPLPLLIRLFPILPLFLRDLRLRVRPLLLRLPVGLLLLVAWPLVERLLRLMRLVGLLRLLRVGAGGRRRVGIRPGRRLRALVRTGQRLRRRVGRVSIRGGFIRAGLIGGGLIRRVSRCRAGARWQRGRVRLDCCATDGGSLRFSGLRPGISGLPRCRLRAGGRCGVLGAGLVVGSVRRQRSERIWRGRERRGQSGGSTIAGCRAVAVELIAGEITRYGVCRERSRRPIWRRRCGSATLPSGGDQARLLSEAGCEQHFGGCSAGRAWQWLATDGAPGHALSWAATTGVCLQHFTGSAR